MIDVKSIFTSKTILGILVALIGMVAPFIQSKFGVVVTGDDGAALMDGASKIVESFGLLLALYGRIKATKKIG